MALFVAYHQHFPESCPAKDSRMGAMLGNHISRENARKAGINIREEAVVNGEHTLYLILDAANAGVVETFMAPFAQAGEVQVWAASSCADVIARRGC